MIKLRSVSGILTTIGFCLALAAIAVWFRGKSEEDIRLSAERALLLEARTIEFLRERGCDVSETEDEWLGASGILVRLFPEHFTDDGIIASEIFDEFRYIRRLYLILDRTPVSTSGLAQLRNLNNLLLLSAQETATTNKGLEQIEGIVSLKLLRLNWTPVDDAGLRRIERLNQLVMLYLSGTRITDEGISSLLVLKNIRAMQIAYTRVTDRGLSILSGLSNIEYLGINSTAATDDSAESLIRMKQLSYVDLTDTKITLGGIRKIKEALPHCRIDRRIVTPAAGSDIAIPPTNEPPSK